MTCGVELVDRVEHPDPEAGLDLAGLARRQEPVQALERLDIPSPRRRAQTLLDQPRDDTVDVLDGDLPRRATARRQKPVEHSLRPGHRPDTGHEPVLMPGECDATKVASRSTISGFACVP